MTYQIIAWTVVVVVTLILEFCTVELISVWFSAGGIVALILACCGVDLTIQIVVFGVLSLALLLSLRKICVKHLKSDHETTNSESLIGTTAKLLDDLDEDHSSSVKIRDVVWTVKGEKGCSAKAGTRVQIVAISGNKLIVKEKGEK